MKISKSIMSCNRCMNRYCKASTVLSLCGFGFMLLIIHNSRLSSEITPGFHLQTPLKRNHRIRLEEQDVKWIKNKFGDISRRLQSLPNYELTSTSTETSQLPIEADAKKNPLPKLRNHEIAIIVIYYSSKPNVGPQVGAKNVESFANPRDLYARALTTLKCYAQRNNYTYLELTETQMNNGNRLASACTQEELSFRRHCLVAVTMKHQPTLKWFYVLDADTAVVNPDHDLRQYLVPDKDLIFYERFHLWEIMTGNYIARNTAYARRFLMELANAANGHWWNPKLRSTTSFDDGALHSMLLREIYGDLRGCSELLKKSYYSYVFCCVHYLRARRSSEHIYIYRRAHAWAVDRHVIKDSWNTHIFMQHGWKETKLQNLDGPALDPLPFGGQCFYNSSVRWSLSKRHYLAPSEMLALLSDQERKQQQLLDLPVLADIRHCWPQCEQLNAQTTFVLPTNWTGNIKFKQRMKTRTTRTPLMKGRSVNDDY